MWNHAQMDAFKSKWKMKIPFRCRWSCSSSVALSLDASDVLQIFGDSFLAVPAPAEVLSPEHARLKAWKLKWIGWWLDVAWCCTQHYDGEPGETHQADLQFFNWSSSADSEHCRGEPALHRGHILHVCGLAAMIEHEHENHDTLGICLDTMNIIKNRNPWKTTLQMQKLVRTRWLWSVLHLPGAWRTTTFVLTWRLHDSGGGSFDHSMSRPCRFCTTFWTLMRSREWRYSPLPQLMQTHRYQHGREIVMMFPDVSCLLSKGSSHLQGSKKCKQLWPLWRNDVSRCSLAAASAELFRCHIRLVIQ